MQIEWVLIAVVAGYLLGSISFSRVVIGLVSPGTNLNAVELKSPDGELGIVLAPEAATTAAMVKGPKGGCTVGLLDMLKAFLPALVFRLFFPDQVQRWGPRRFDHDRGFLAVDPIGILVSSGLGMILGFMVVSDPLVAYLAGLWLMIPWTAILLQGCPQMIYVLVINLLFILAMIPELKFYLKARRKARAAWKLAWIPPRWGNP